MKAWHPASVWLGVWLGLWLVVGLALAWPYATWMGHGEAVGDEYARTVRFQLVAFAYGWLLVGVAVVAVFALTRRPKRPSSD